MHTTSEKERRRGRGGEKLKKIRSNDFDEKLQVVYLAVQHQYLAKCQIIQQIGTAFLRFSKK